MAVWEVKRLQVPSNGREHHFARLPIDAVVEGKVPDTPAARASMWQRLQMKLPSGNNFAAAEYKPLSSKVPCIDESCGATTETVGDLSRNARLFSDVQDLDHSGHPSSGPKAGTERWGYCVRHHHAWTALKAQAELLWRRNSVSSLEDMHGLGSQAFSSPRTR